MYGQMDACMHACTSVSASTYDVSTCICAYRLRYVYRQSMVYKVFCSYVYMYVLT